VSRTTSFKQRRIFMLLIEAFQFIFTVIFHLQSITHRENPGLAFQEMEWSKILLHFLFIVLSIKIH
jgi:hypothetical protein